MRNVWEKEYAKLLEGKPKNAWIPWMNGDWERYEISVVHTSFPHGLSSWGWSGDRKIVLASTGPHERPEKKFKKYRKQVIQKLMEVARVTAEELNKQKLDFVESDME